jgi:hypothetical protein
MSALYKREFLDLLSYASKADPESQRLLAVVRKKTGTDFWHGIIRITQRLARQAILPDEAKRFVLLWSCIQIRNLHPGWNAELEELKRIGTNETHEEAIARSEKWMAVFRKLETAVLRWHLEDALAEEIEREGLSPSSGKAGDGAWVFGYLGEQDRLAAEARAAEAARRAHLRVVPRPEPVAESHA